MGLIDSIGRNAKKVWLQSQLDEANKRVKQLQKQLAQLNKK